MAEIKWEKVLTNDQSTTSVDYKGSYYYTSRAKVPGGWLVRSMKKDHERNAHGYDIAIGVGLTFIPDPSHSWK